MRKPLSMITTGLAAGALLLTGATYASAGAGAADAPTSSAAAAEPYKVLVVGKTLGFRHSHIDETTNAVIEMGQEHGFTVDVWDPPIGSSPGQPDLTMATTPFTSTEALSQYATIMFASPVDGTNREVEGSTRPRTLDDAELAAFQGYIRQGGGFVGLHAATDEMHAVPWFSELTGGGARFRNHPRNQTATMRVESPGHPSTTMLPKEWIRYDEWYNFTANPRDDVHVLLTLDESTYTGGTMGEDHPIAWCHNFEGGRSWYEGAGHVDESYEDPTFLAHLLGGIEWTAGVAEGGGNCVTFPEVEEITADLSEGGNRNAKLGGDVAEALAAAEAAAEEGDHAAAAHILKKAKGKAHGLQDETLVEKLADLVDWQGGLVGY